MTLEQETWAEASAVLRWKGEHAHVFVAERIGSLALVGDIAGVERWKQIAACLQHIVDAPEA